MQPDPVRSVVEQELALLTPAVRRSPDALDQLLDPEFREVGASGRLWTRDEIIAALLAESGDSRAEPTASDLAGTVLAPDLVLLTYRSDHGGHRARRMSLWRRTAGVWRVLYHQGTPLGGDEG